MPTPVPMPHVDPRAARPAEVFGYALLATALCFAVASPALLGWLGGELAATVVPFAQLTPLLTALVFWKWTTADRRPLRQVLALRWSWPGIWLGVATVAAISAVQLLAGVAAGWQPKPVQAIAAATVAVAPFWVLQSVFAIGEELGWRGWLATRTITWPFPAAAATSAVIWMVWHLPAVSLIDTGTGARVAYLAAIASWAPFLVALRRATGSVWSAVATHGALNSVRVFFLQSIPRTSGVNWTVEALGWVLWLLAAWWLGRRTR